MRARKSPNKTLDYLLPFLIFICLGIITILAFQLYRNFFPANQKSEAFLYNAEGKSEILPWGLTEWEQGINGSKLRSGDTIRTAENSQVIIKFFDGSIIRLSENSELILNDLSEYSSQFFTEVNLNSGEIWINAKDIATKESLIEIHSSNTINTIEEGQANFRVLNSQEFALYSGKSSHQILNTDEENNGKLLSSINLTAQNKFTLTAQKIDQLNQNPNLDLVSQTSEDFWQNPWIEWNLKEDQDPSDFTNVVTPIIPNETDSSGEITSTNPEETSETNNENQAKPLSPELEKPSKNPFQTSENKVEISGIAASSATKIIISTIDENGDEDEYQLKNFTPGSGTWKYNASTALGNLRTGKNTFKIYAENSVEIRSEPLTLVVIYNPISENDSSQEIN